MNMLIRPLPKPDEFGRGYFGRVMCLNGIKKDWRMIDYMKRNFGLVYRPKFPLTLFELLSLMAGMSLQQFAKFHTTFPIRNAITLVRPDISSESKSGRMLQIRCLSVLREGAYFCPDCVSEDEAFHGFSYWRRDHQMAGQLWCTKHLSPLKFNYSQEAFLQSPSNCLFRGETVNSQCFDEAIKNIAVKKFLNIAAGLQTHAKSLNARSVANALSERAEIAGLQTTTSDGGPLLSDLIRSSFPKMWLRSVVPSIDGYSQTFRNSIAKIVDKQDSVKEVFFYILSAAVLFDSADEALTTMLNTSGDVLSEQKSASLQILSL